MPGRDPLLTPVEPFSASSPKLSDAEWQGLALRHDALLGRMPGFLGPNDQGAPGVVQDIHAIKKVLGRMPGSNGVDDAGDGIAAHVFDQKRKSTFAAKASVTAITASAMALLVAVIHLASAYADSQARQYEAPRLQPAPPAATR